MSKINSKLWLAISILFSILLVIYSFSYVVITPWHILPNIGGDGAKNNFTFLYHSLYGKGYWFDGMNYPYGEHIVFTDGIPVLSVFFALIKNVPVETALSTLWWLFGISYVVSILFLYLILNKFKVKPLLSIIFSSLIGIFTPQIFGLQGHYGLGFAHLIPMVFYWSVCYFENQKIRYPIYIFFTGLFSAFIHPYFGGVVFIWTLFYAIGCFLTSKDILRLKLKMALPILISGISILIFVGIIMKLTDPIKDRPITPYGMLVYCTTGNQIFTSSITPFWKYLREKSIFKDSSEGSEGYTYLGLVVLLVVVISFIRGLVFKVKKKNNKLIIYNNQFSTIWLFIALASLLFAMGVPFVWDMEWLTNYLSVFKQFRTLGQFSWIFYYIITIYGVVVLVKWYDYFIFNKKYFIGYLIIIISIGIWSWEASSYVQITRHAAETAKLNYDIVFPKTEQNWTDYFKEHHLDRKDFQAILALPYYHVGTDKFWVGKDGGAGLCIAYNAALQLKLPIIDVLLSRSSWGQAAKQLKLFAGPYTEKSMLHEINANIPFLLMQYEEDSLNIDDKYLLKSSEYIGHFSRCNLYAFFPSRLLHNDMKFRDSINKIASFLKLGSDTCIGLNNSYYINHFDSLKNKITFLGTGAQKVITENEYNLATIPISNSYTKNIYEFSCWLLLDSTNYRSPYFLLELLDNNNNIINTITVLTKESVDSHNMWFRAFKYFEIDTNCKYIRCRLMNHPNPAYYALDELMVRPVETLIISKSYNGKIMVNNHLLNNLNK